jgi:uncharacterized protein (DUF952 family)
MVRFIAREVDKARSKLITANFMLYKAEVASEDPLSLRSYRAAAAGRDGEYERVKQCLSIANDVYAGGQPNTVEDCLQLYIYLRTAFQAAESTANKYREIYTTVLSYVDDSDGAYDRLNWELATADTTELKLYVNIMTAVINAMTDSDNGCSHV